MSDLAQRYGTTGRARRTAILVGVVLLAAAFLGWLLWVMLLHARPAVQSQLVSFHVQGEHSIEARFTVVRRERDTANCLLRAYAQDHAVVGDQNVVVRPSAPLTATLTQSVRTERRATTVDLLGCTTAEQHRRR